MVDRALTPTERRVAQLVAAGKSEAELVTELRLAPHLVAWHLSRARRKLGLDSREPGLSSPHNERDKGETPC